jgi:hypothetical protein
VNLGATLVFCVTRYDGQFDLLLDPEWCNQAREQVGYCEAFVTGFCKGEFEIGTRLIPDWPHTTALSQTFHALCTQCTLQIPTYLPSQPVIEHDPSVSSGFGDPILGQSAIGLDWDFLTENQLDPMSLWDEDGARSIPPTVPADVNADCSLDELLAIFGIDAALLSSDAMPSDKWLIKGI